MIPVCKSCLSLAVKITEWVVYTEEGKAEIDVDDEGPGDSWCADCQEESDGVMWIKPAWIVGLAFGQLPEHKWAADRLLQLVGWREFCDAH